MIHSFQQFYRSFSGKRQIHTPARLSRLLPLLLMLLSLSALWACQTAGPNGGSSPAAETAGQSEAGPGTDDGSETHGGNTSPDESTEPHMEALKEQAMQLAADMRAGDFESVAALFNDQMAAALTADALREGWDATTLPLGAYVGFVSAQAQALETGVSVAVVEKYEGNGILIQFSFDASDRIQGLWITYQDVSGLEVQTPADAEDEDAVLVPAVPENVREEEILVSGSPDYPLPGTLTLPTDTERPPVVILVHGSGSSDRNENINGNTPFRDIAWGLASQGIASIRYDKRYYVYPQAAADPSSVTLESEVLEDVDAAIALAMSDSRLDSGRVYVLGHSLGGMLTPAIADSHPQLAGIISMAGSLRSLWDISYDQNQEAAEAARSGLSEEENQLLDQQLALVEADIDTLRRLSADEQLADLSRLPDSVSADSVLLGLPLTYWSSLDRFAGRRFVDRLTMPVLVLQGDADFQVYPDRDYPLWQEALSGHENAVFHLYPGLNHLLMPTQGRRDLSEYAVKSAVSPEVIADIADFIHSETGEAEAPSA